MLRLAAAALTLAFVTGSAVPALAQSHAVTASGESHVAALTALVDSHLRSEMVALEGVAASRAARSGEWSAIAPRLRVVAHSGLSAVLFYANPKGVYWTLTGGKQSANVADRAYFKTVMGGHPSVGVLIVSRSTGKNLGVVAVPVTDAKHRVIGLLGAGVYLDAFSLQIAKEMKIEGNEIFWAIDAKGIIALHSDTSNIFNDPAKMSKELADATKAMLAHHSGTATYAYMGRTRTVNYLHSAFSGWTFGFGVLH